MDIDHIVFLINSVGFPIVACGFMFKQNRELSQSIEKLNGTLISLDRRIEILELHYQQEEQNK